MFTEQSKINVYRGMLSTLFEQQSSILFSSEYV